MKQAFIPGKPKRISGTLIKGNGKPLHSKTIGRNESCRCGSGKKSKKCCGSDTKYFKQ
jgi:uncharacterized protein YecA (UPF0149 family)